MAAHTLIFLHCNAFYLKKPKLAFLRLREHLGRGEEPLQLAPAVRHMSETNLDSLALAEPLQSQIRVAEYSPHY